MYRRQRTMPKQEVIRVLLRAGYPSEMTTSSRRSFRTRWTLTVTDTSWTGSG